MLIINALNTHRCIWHYPCLLPAGSPALLRQFQLERLGRESIHETLKRPWKTAKPERCASSFRQFGSNGREFCRYQGGLYRGQLLIICYEYLKTHRITVSLGGLLHCLPKYACRVGNGDC